MVKQPTENASRNASRNASPTASWKALRTTLLPAAVAPLGIGVVAFGIVVASTASSHAQAIDCAAYRTELASISRGADPRAQEYLVAAQRQRGELERTRAYYNQLGCTRSDNFRVPGECSSLRAHMQQMQANLNEMLSYADRLGGGPRSQQRRRQLQAALDRHCAHEPERPRGFFERLFGGDSRAAREAPPVPEAPAVDAIPEAGGNTQEPRLGGSQPVCVRLADGYFFPLGGRFQGAAHAQQLCQAQCPAARTELFFMTQGGTIERAQSASGVPYGTLPNALVYRKRLLPEAGCVPAGQSWEQALQNAQALIGHHEGDIIVTAEKARELSRVGVTARSATRTSSGRNAQTPPPPADIDADADDVADAASLPTAGGESAGIGPGLPGSESTISRQEGRTITAPGPDGNRRNVRIVAPYLIPTPETLRRD